MGTIKQKYPDFGPPFASEKLRKKEDIYVSRETVRKLMIEEGMWQANKSNIMRETMEYLLHFKN